MRQFVGIQPSEEFRNALLMVQSRLRAAGVAAGYLDPFNFHMTLAFIGEWPENVSGCLPQVKQPFALKLSHIGIFPEARVIWAGTEASDALDRLAQRVRDNLDAAGIPFDSKPYVPHITLGRKPLIPPDFDYSAIVVPPAAMTVTDVCLYRSCREETGMVYSVIGRSSEQGGR